MMPVVSRWAAGAACAGRRLQSLSACAWLPTAQRWRFLQTAARYASPRGTTRRRRRSTSTLPAPRSASGSSKRRLLPMCFAAPPSGDGVRRRFFAWLGTKNSDDCVLSLPCEVSPSHGRRRAGVLCGAYGGIPDATPLKRNHLTFTLLRELDFALGLAETRLRGARRSPFSARCPRSGGACQRRAARSSARPCCL